MKEGQPVRIYTDFWDYWSDQFVQAGYDPDYISTEMQMYKEHSENPDVWPEGSTTMKRALLGVFKEILNGE